MKPTKKSAAVLLTIAFLVGPLSAIAGAEVADVAYYCEEPKKATAGSTTVSTPRVCVPTP